MARYIEPNFKVKADLVPNDPYWSKQWGPQIIEADWAWNTTTGNSSILVAVPDSGIDYTHPDLAANYVALGYDWVNNDTDPIDDGGHGTHCAGIIAAVLNNNVGIAGVAQVRIMAEKILNRSGWGTEADAAKAIIHAVDQGAKIISCSWSGDVDSVLAHEAIQYACDNDVLVIASAGNQAWDLRIWPRYPAVYDEVVSVAATNYSEECGCARFSNWGEIELAAPGVDIYSTTPTFPVSIPLKQGYDNLTGTSMSCPHVAGVAALIWSQFPNYTQREVRTQLRRTADDLGEPGFDIYYGYGRVNARTAVEDGLPDHDLFVSALETPRALQPGTFGTLSTIVSNFGRHSEVNVTLQVSVNGSLFNSTTIDFIEKLGGSVTVNVTWTSWIEGMYEITSYVVPVANETITENNKASKYIWVRTPRTFRVPEDYPTIEKAIEATESGWGDKVAVAPGTYYEYLTLDKSDLTIIGEDAKTTIIDANYTETCWRPAPPPWLPVCSGVTVIKVEDASNVNISDFTIQHGRIGIFLLNSKGCILRNISLTENEHNLGVSGKELSQYIHDIDTSNTVDGKPIYYWINEHHKTFPLDAGYVAAIGCTNIKAKDLQVTSNREGVLVAYSHTVTIENVTASSNSRGIDLRRSHEVSVSNNVIKNSSSSGIILDYSDGNTIMNNRIENNLVYKHLTFGIAVRESDDNTVLSNTITVLHNFSLSLSADGIGIWLHISNNNVLMENKVTGIGGKKAPPDWLLDVLEYGIYMWSSGSNTVANNTLTNLSSTAIGLWNALTHDNIISNNTVTNTCEHAFGSGFYLSSAQNNTFCGNTLKDINTGMMLYHWSRNNTVYCNYFGNNSCGISVGKRSINDSFCNNNFIDNKRQVEASNSSVWDSGYPSGGNYWSDYTGIDLYSGAYQNETGSDGIGDIPYVIDENDIDRYPLMNPWRPPDIAVMNVAPSETVGVEGFTLGIDVAVENQGLLTETFDVTVYADKNVTVIRDEIIIANQTVPSLKSGLSTLTFIWNTTGVAKGEYTILARASQIPYETDIADNTKAADSKVTVLSPGHDIAIKNINLSKTVICQGYSLTINVTGKNFGNFPETFNVTIFANTTVIGKLLDVTLKSGSFTTITFSWNTTGFTEGNYVIGAIATSVPEETDTTDNTYSCAICITIPGDVDGDFDVDLYDAVKLLVVYRAKAGSPSYDPNCDIDGDGIIDLYDAVRLLTHYGQKYP